MQFLQVLTQFDQAKQKGFWTQNGLPWAVIQLLNIKSCFNLGWQPMCILSAILLSIFYVHSMIYILLHCGCIAHSFNIPPSPPPPSIPALVEVAMLFSCMCMMASDTLTEMESAASSMLKGPSSFSDTWYRASDRVEWERWKMEHWIKVWKQKDEGRKGKRYNKKDIRFVFMMGAMFKTLDRNAMYRIDMTHLFCRIEMWVGSIQYISTCIMFNIPLYRISPTKATYTLPNARLQSPLTNEIVPLSVQIGCIGQAALHHVEAEGVAGAQGGHASTQWAVPLTHQGTHTPCTSTQLEEETKSRRCRMLGRSTEPLKADQ